MLKLEGANWVGDYRIEVMFSDGTGGVYDFAALLAKETALTVPLRDIQMFKCFFLELGALCWPNRLEFNPVSLHKNLQEAGKLRRISKAA